MWNNDESEDLRGQWCRKPEDTLTAAVGDIFKKSIVMRFDGPTSDYKSDGQRNKTMKIQ